MTWQDVGPRLAYDYREVKGDRKNNSPSYCNPNNLSNGSHKQKDKVRDWKAKARKQKP